MDTLQTAFGAIGIAPYALGKKTEAIKRVRQRTGMGLKEAKDYVERL